MSYVKNAMIDCYEAGAAWIDAAIVYRWSDDGLSPKTIPVKVCGHRGPTTIEAVPYDELRRLLPLVAEHDRTMVADEIDNLDAYRGEL